MIKIQQRKTMCTRAICAAVFLNWNSLFHVSAHAPNFATMRSYTKKSLLGRDGVLTLLPFSLLSEQMGFCPRRLPSKCTFQSGDVHALWENVLAGEPPLTSHPSCQCFNMYCRSSGRFLLGWLSLIKMHLSLPGCIVQTPPSLTNHTLMESKLGQ